MKRFILGLFATVTCADAGIVFDKEIVEVTVKPDATEFVVEYPFKVDEKGAEITNYDAPCSCLSARIEPLNEDRSARLKWKAGETGRVLGKFELGNFKGTVEKAIVLNIKDQGPVQLIVKVTIPDLVAITPTTHRWVQGEAPEPKVYKIKIGGDKPLNIKEIKGTNPNFAFELITKKPGREYEVKVSPGDLKSPGLGLLRITTDSEYRRFKRVQMFAVVQAKK